MKTPKKMKGALFGEFAIYSMDLIRLKSHVRVWVWFLWPEAESCLTLSLDLKLTSFHCWSQALRACLVTKFLRKTVSWRIWEIHIWQLILLKDFGLRNHPSETTPNKNTHQIWFSINIKDFGNTHQIWFFTSTLRILTLLLKWTRMTLICTDRSKSYAEFFFFHRFSNSRKLKIEALEESSKISHCCQML